MALSFDPYIEGLKNLYKKAKPIVAPITRTPLPSVQIPKPQGLTAPPKINIELPGVKKLEPVSFMKEAESKPITIGSSTYTDDKWTSTDKTMKLPEPYSPIRDLAGKAAVYPQKASDFLSEKIQKGGPTPFGFIPSVPTEAEADSGGILSGILKNTDRTIRSGLTGVLDGVFKNSADALNSFAENRDLDALMSGFIATISTVPATAPMMALWNAFLETEGGKATAGALVDTLVKTGDSILKVDGGYDYLVDSSNLSDKWKYEAKSAPRHLLALAGFHVLTQAWESSTKRIVDLVPKEYKDTPLAKYFEETGAPKRIAIEREWVKAWDKAMSEAPQKFYSFLKEKLSDTRGEARIGDPFGKSFYDDIPSSKKPTIPEASKPEVHKIDLKKREAEIKKLSEARKKVDATNAKELTGIIGGKKQPVIDPAELRESERTQFKSGVVTPLETVGGIPKEIVQADIQLRAAKNAEGVRGGPATEVYDKFVTEVYTPARLGQTYDFKPKAYAPYITANVKVATSRGILRDTPTLDTPLGTKQGEVARLGVYRILEVPGPEGTSYVLMQEGKAKPVFKSPSLTRVESKMRRYDKWFLDRAKPQTQQRIISRTMPKVKGKALLNLYIKEAKAEGLTFEEFVERNSIIPEYGTINTYFKSDPFTEQILKDVRVNKGWDFDLIGKSQRWNMEQVLVDKPVYWNDTPMALSNEMVIDFAKKNNLPYGIDKSGAVIVGRDIKALERFNEAYEKRDWREVGLALGYTDIGVMGKGKKKAAMAELKKLYENTAITDFRVETKSEMPKVPPVKVEVSTPPSVTEAPSATPNADAFVAGLEKKVGKTKAKRVKKELDDKKAEEIEIGSTPEVEAKLTEDYKNIVSDVVDSFEGIGGGKLPPPPASRLPMPFEDRPGRRRIGDVMDEIRENYGNSENIIDYISNWGFKDGHIKDPKLRAVILDYNKRMLEANEKAIELLRNLYGNYKGGKFDLNSLMIALEDLQIRSFARDKRMGKEVPREFQDEQLFENLVTQRAQALASDPVAKRMSAQLEANRRIVLKDLMAAGAKISKEMFNDPDYFPKDIWDPFSYKAQPKFRNASAAKPSFLKSKKGSDLDVNPNLPQTILEMYEAAYRAIPAMELQNTIVEMFAIPGEKPGTYFHPKSKSDLPEGYVEYEKNLLNIYTREMISKSKLREALLAGDIIDPKKLAENILMVGEGVKYAIPKEVADWLARDKAERERMDTFWRTATGKWKGFAVMSNPIKYFMRNLYSDGVGALAYSNNPVMYVKYYAEAWADMAAYYTNGYVSPSLREALSNGMLETGFASETFKNKLLNSPELSRMRREVFGGTSKIKTMGLGWQNFVRMQEAVARIALARDLGGGRITTESAAQANDMLVNFRNMTGARRGGEVISPFLQWTTGTIQSLLRTMTMQDGKYMKFSEKQRFSKAARVWGLLGASFLLYNSIVNNRGKEDESENDALWTAMEKDHDKRTPYDFHVMLQSYKDRGGYVPNHYSILLNSRGEPVITSGGGVALVVADNPMSATDLLVDPINAVAQGRKMEWARGKVNPLFVGIGELMMNQKINGGRIYNEEDKALFQFIDGTVFEAGKLVPMINTVKNFLNKNQEGGMARTPRDTAVLSLQYVAPILVMDMSKVMGKITEQQAVEEELPAIRNEMDIRNRIATLNQNFAPLIENFVGHRIKEAFNVPSVLLPKLRPKDPEGFEKAKQAWLFLKEQRPEDQIELFKGLLLKFRDPATLALYGKSPSIVFNILKAQYDKAEAEKETSPKTFREKRLKLIAYTDTFTGDTLQRLSFNDPVTYKNIMDQKEKFTKMPITKEELDYVKQEALFAKLMSASGKDYNDLYKELDEFGRFLFGAEWTPDMQITNQPIPEAYTSQPPQPTQLPSASVKPQLPGVGDPRIITVAKKKDDRKKVSLEPISYLNKLTPYNY